MATPQAGATPGLELSTLDRFLIEKTEEAVRDGLQLEQWIRRRDTGLRFFPLDLVKTYRLSNRAEGFFDSLEINGKSRSVMGCRQLVQFGKIARPNAPELLRDFVLGEFLTRAHWTYPDGYPGGFTIEQSLYKTAGGAYGRFTGDAVKGCVDLRRLGADYAWVLLTAQIHDFVMDFGPFKKRFKEAACVAPNTEFVHVAENPSDEYVLEVSIGYPFIEYAPIPNVFGFGPGKFGVAVKLYSFFLTPKNDVVARMYFAAAPRCQKVFDFGKTVPDPVYGGAKLCSQLALGLWNTDRFHNKLDTGMLAQHCRVHQALMDGTQKVWTDWINGGAA